MFTLKISMRFLAVLFLDITLFISFYVKLKRKRIQTDERKRNFSYDIVLLVISIGVLIFIKGYLNVFFSSPFWVCSDPMVHLQTIQALRFGTYPPPNLRAGGSVNTEYHSNLLSFPYHSAMLEIANFQSVEGILTFSFLLNAIISVTLLLLIYLIEFTGSEFAGIIAIISLGLGTDVLGISNYLTKGFLPAYWGVKIPFVSNLGRGILFFHVPTIAHQLMLVGLEKGPPLILSLFFIYIVKKYEVFRKRSLLIALIFLMLPIYPLFHVGILGIFYLGIIIYLMTLALRKLLKYQENSLLLIIFPVIISLNIFYFLSYLKPFDLPSYYLRMLPLDVSARSLLTYFGPSLFFALVGLVHLLRKPKLSLSRQFIVVWFSVSLTSILFVDFYSTHRGYFVNYNYFPYYSATIPIILLAGIGFRQLISPAINNWRKPANFSNLLLITAMIFLATPSSVSIYMTDYEELWTSINPEFYALYITQDDIHAYNFVISNTPKDSIFLTHPRNWLIAPLTGRSIVVQHRESIEFDQRKLDVTQMYWSRDLRKTANLLDKYSVDYIFLSSQELNEYGINTRKFSYYPEVFPVIFSKGNVTLFSVNHDALGNLSGMYMPVMFSPVDERHLVLQLNFNENEGLFAYNSSGYTGLGSLEPNPPDNYPQWVSGDKAIEGSALSFDGIDDYVDFGIKDVFELSSALTLEGWFNIPVGAAGGRGLLQKNPATYDYDYMLYLTSSGYGAIYFKNPAGMAFSAIYTADLRDGTWHHWVGTFDGTKLKFYIDGSLKTTVNATGETVRNSDTSLYLFKGWGGYIQGIADEIRIYNMALTKEKIRELYFFGKYLLSLG